MATTYFDQDLKKRLGLSAALPAPVQPTAQPTVQPTQPAITQRKLVVQVPAGAVRTKTQAIPTSNNLGIPLEFGKGVVSGLAKTTQAINSVIPRIETPEWFGYVPGLNLITLAVGKDKNFDIAKSAEAVKNSPMFQPNPNGGLGQKLAYGAGEYVAPTILSSAALGPAGKLVPTGIASKGLRAVEYIAPTQLIYDNKAGENELVGRAKAAALDVAFPYVLNKVGGKLLKVGADKVKASETGKLVNGIDTSAPDLLEKTAESYINKNIPKGRVNAIDYVRTPQYVFDKIGLGNEFSGLRDGIRKYQIELPKELDKVGSWAKRMSGPDSNTNIFKHLDGQPVQLDNNDLQIANEMKDYLKGWADRLKLPEDKRISNYITHIWDQGEIQKDFPEEIANIINKRVTGSVYDPFLEARKGGVDYKEDAIAALDAYVKRATRKVNTDPYLKAISDFSEKNKATLNNKTYDYIKGELAHINMQPSYLEGLVDNALKDSTPIGLNLGQRPTAAISTNLTRNIYRATLGGNISSPIKNLLQGTNTYATLGEKYTLLGYAQLAKKAATRDLGELTSEGILSNNIVQDRQVNAVKKFGEKLDDVLFYLFDKAETINRGSAYYGAKQKFLDAGLDEAQAIAKARQVVEKTQFVFGRADTPAITNLGGYALKPFTMFTSYPMKQAEFLVDLAKNNKVGLLRYIGANMLLYGTIGKTVGWSQDKLFGLIPTDTVPFASQLTGDNPYTPPAITVFNGITSIPGLGSEDEKVQEQSQKNVDKAIFLTIPAGSQIKKTLEGVSANQSGGYVDSRGRLRYPVGQELSDQIRNTVFGPNTSELAQFYYDSKIGPLSQKDTLTWKSEVDSGTDPVKAWASLQKNKLTYFTTGDMRAIAKDLQLTPQEKADRIQKLRETYIEMITKLDEVSGKKVEQKPEQTSTQSTPVVSTQAIAGVVPLAGAMKPVYKVKGRKGGAIKTPKLVVKQYLKPRKSKKVAQLKLKTLT